MTPDDDIIRLARRLVDRLTDWAALQTPIERQPSIRAYYESKGPIYRQLSQRLLMARKNGLRQEDAVRWSIAELRKTVSERASTDEARQQYENWFTTRSTMLRGVTSQFWRFAEENEVLSSSQPFVVTRELIAEYLRVPLSVEADPAKRTAGNLAAVDVLSSGRPLGERERRVLAGYTGWGGLSIERIADRLPPKWTPEPSALIHEYYTPPLLCLELARVLRRYVEALAKTNGKVIALEPSAGIGRFVHALSGAGYENVEWTAVEYSPISAAILAAMRPDIRVVQGSFESFVTKEEESLLGQVHLVVSNPPYGERGATTSEDPNPDYQDRKAYVYFLRRCLDALAALGYGVFLIPYGFLTGQNGEMTALRKRVLKRHHLMAAFRLPSSLFPGANIVTDLILFQSRGGELAEVDKDDAAIVEGRYFELFPSHLLGTELRSDDAEAQQRLGKKPRFGYEVMGVFQKLPDFEPRPLCATCAPAVITPPKSVQSSQVAEYLLPAEIQTAILVGKRVAKFLALVASTDESRIELAQRQHSELLTALMEIRALWSGSPRKDRTLVGHAKSRKDIVSLLSAFTDEGEIIPQIRERPRYQPRYRGSGDDVSAQALFLYRSERGVTIASLMQFRRSLGQESHPVTLRAALIAARWAMDGEHWLPEQDYYSGFLWPRFDRAKKLAEESAGDIADALGDKAIAASQAARLLDAIGPVTLSVIEPDPRLPWIPLYVLRPWITQYTEIECPALERRNYYLAPTGVPAEELLKHTTPPSHRTMFGFLNHDYQLFFIPNAPKQVDGETGNEESDSSAQARARLEYEEKALASFRAFLRGNAADAEVVVEAYNRTYRGYIEPTYTDWKTPSRWGSRVSLRPHQESGAARLLWHQGGLLAFDVGVGKTFTGIATVAKLREEGKARRPVFIVPNSLLFQWLKGFQTALPDYRVLVIGAERYVGRSGALVSRTDKPEERAAKWRMFQAGGADVVILSYTTFAKVGVRRQSRAGFAWASPAMRKMFGLQARNAAADADDTDAAGKKKKRKAPKQASQSQLEKRLGAQMRGMTKEELDTVSEEIAREEEREREADRRRILEIIASLANVSEREQAVIQNRIERWAGLEEANEEHDGVFWEDLGIDALFVDEAQNFKNLWPVHRGTEKLPKYLGGIETSSQRALDFAIRAHLVRQKNGGSGVYLLSATPAKNSPLEYFSLLSLVDGDAWARLGITDTSDFIARYLKIERKLVLDTDLAEVSREVVTGFRNIQELKDILFRFSEFRTAQEVGLLLPKSVPQTIKVPMGKEQEEVHQRLLNKYRYLIADRSAGARHQALGSLMQMSLVSLHPALYTQRPKEGWNKSNWNRVTEISSPKLEYIASEVMKKRLCGHIIFGEPVGFHYWMRELLVQKGAPRERIAILNAEEAPTALRRQVIAEKFNGTPAILDEHGNVEMEAIPPEYDVVIANSVAYEGIDLHIRTCIVHHGDLPWEPATLQQRNGRAVRQGNTQAVIGINYYISQGSIDAARLTIILGKLTWMKDIFAGSERETNNPAAGSELSQDELVAFLYSPEELSTLRAQMAQKREIEDRRAARRRAWTLIKRIYEHQGTKGKSAVELGQDDHATRELLKQLREIPTQTWPWHGTLVKAVLDGFACAFFDLVWRTQSGWEAAGEERVVTVALWERAVFVSGGDGPQVRFQVGVVGADYVSIRMAESIEWVRIDQQSLHTDYPLMTSLHAALRHATPDQFGPQRWPATVDKLATEQRLTEALDRLTPTVDPLGPLGMQNAPDAWRQMVWDSWGERILSSLERTFLVPRESGPALALPAFDLGPKHPPPIPFTERGFARFVDRAKQSGDKWSELNQLSKDWFQRPFPKGVLGKDQTENAKGQDGQRAAAGTAMVKAGNGELVSVEAPWIKGGLAVTRVPGSEPARWSLTHSATGLALAHFLTTETAQRFAEWALTLPMDWTKSEEQVREQMRTVGYRGFKKTAEWIATWGDPAFARPKTQLPAVPQIQRYFEESD